MPLITCPSCGHEFEAENALTEHIRAELEKEHKQKLAITNNIIKQKEKEMEELKAQQEALKAKQEEQIKEIKEKANKEAELQLRQKLMKQLEEENAEKNKALKEEIEAKDKKLKEAQKLEIELLKAQNQLKEEKEKMEFELQKKIEQQRQAIREEGKIAAQEQFALKEQELKEKINAYEVRIAEMSRRKDEISSRKQGEAQELALQAMLQDAFETDEVEPVPTGTRGADCILKVKTRLGEVAGSIVFESKRTAHFSNDWLRKLKEDTAKVKGNLCVLVTEAVPDNFAGVEEIDGVWVVKFNTSTVLIVTQLLRDGLLRAFEISKSQENKGDKMVMLYNYLTGQEFKMLIQTIIESYSNELEELEKEKKQTETRWKKREKNLEKITLNLSHMWGSIKGIAGNSIGTIKELEGGE